jgi:hypothetical protein
MDALDLAMNDLTRLMQNHALLTRRWMEMSKSNLDELYQGKIVVAEVGRPVPDLRPRMERFQLVWGWSLTEDWIRLHERFNGISVAPRKFTEPGPSGLQVVPPEHLSESILSPVLEGKAQYGGLLLDNNEGWFSMGGLRGRGSFLLQLAGEEFNAVRGTVYWAPMETSEYILIANDLAEWLSQLYQSALYLPDLFRRAKVPRWG